MVLAEKGISIASRILNEAKRNYFITEKECWLLFWVCISFTVFSRKVVTDYSALTKMTKRKSLFSRMIKWFLKLAL